MKKINYGISYFFIICLFSVSFYSSVNAEYFDSPVFQISTGTKFSIEMNTDQYMVLDSEFRFDKIGRAHV